MLIVPTTDGEAIEQFSLRVAEAWKIGRKKIDDGALLVIAKNDRRLRIEVGYGLEGALTDATTKRIIDEDITPKFKAGDFGGGVAAGVDKIVRVVNGEKLPEPEPPHWQDSQSFDPSDLFNPFLIIPAIFFGGLLRSLLGRLLGSATAGALTALIAWFMVGSVLAAVIVGVIASLIRVDQRRFHVSGAGPPGQHWRLVRRLRRLMVQRRQFEQQRRLQWRRRQLWRRRLHRGAGSMGIRRIGRHLLEHRWRLRRILPPQALARIEQAIKAGEATHSGQVRFVVEGALDGAPLFRNQPARERALDIFSQLRIWDTVHNNGVLIYLLLADHDFEIVADRGIDAKVGHAGWEKICVEMEAQFRAGNFEGGVIRGVEAVSRELATHFPRSGGGRMNYLMHQW